MAVDDNGNGARVTNKELDTRMAELKDLMAARFDVVAVKLDAVAAVAARVSDLERENRATGLHLVSMQDQIKAGVLAHQELREEIQSTLVAKNDDEKFWRRNWPSLALGALAVAVAALGLFL